MVQTSCGYAVPYYEAAGDRDMLQKWTKQRGKEGIEQYWKDKNVTSLDGESTGIFADE